MKSMSKRKKSIVARITETVLTGELAYYMLEDNKITNRLGALGFST